MEEHDGDRREKDRSERERKRVIKWAQPSSTNSARYMIYGLDVPYEWLYYLTAISLDICPWILIFAIVSLPTKALVNSSTCYLSNTWHLVPKKNH